MTTTPQRIDMLVSDALSQALVRPTDQPFPSAAPVLTAEQIKSNLLEWDAKYTAAKSDATLKAVRADWQVFTSWCERNQAWALPVESKHLLRFLMDQVVLGKKRSTIGRYINTIRLVHRGAQLADPTAYPLWKLEWEGVVKALARNRANAARQAVPMRSSHVSQLLASLGESLMDLRDAALISLASDTLCREAELARLTLEDLKPSGNGWSVDLRFSKTDQEGIGTTRYCSPDTKKRIDAWCAAAGIESGYLFLPVGRSSTFQLPPPDARKPLGAIQVARIFRRRAVRAGVPDGHQFTGHSARVGSAIELLEAGFSVTDVQYAGGWNDPDQVLHYGKTALAGQNAMAKLRRTR